MVMKVRILRNETSQPIKYSNVTNAYTKGGLFCVLFKENGLLITHKYPIKSLFRVEESQNE